MKDKTLLLTIQTAVDPVSVTLTQGEQLLSGFVIEERFAVCRMLAYEIAQMLETHDLRSNDLDCIAVCTGPGSFTGIRIGVATAKAMTHALSLPVISVDSLTATAVQVDKVYSKIWVFLHAGKARYYAGRYDRQERRITSSIMLTEPEVRSWMDAENVKAFAQAQQEDTHRENILCGQIDPFLSHLAQEIGAETVEFYPHAKWVAAVAREKYRAGDVAEPLSLQPFYLRLSSPEERVNVSTEG